MRSSGIRRWIAAGLMALSANINLAFADRLLLNETEIAAIVRHGPWPGEAPRDPSNRVSGNPAAVELGRRLFFDPRLSRTRTVSCATCHQPDKGWSDGKARAEGIARLDRNSLSVRDSARNRWFGWDGRNDSLWAHSIGPILDPAEMGADAGHVARLLAEDLALAGDYRRTFGKSPSPHDHETTLVDIGKALAAFQETIVSGGTSFDGFRDALARGDRTAAAKYPEAAQRGAQLFVGRGKCHFCHLGPSFSNGEFADVGVPFFVAPGRVDPGRHGGIAKLRQSPFNLTGRHNDDPQKRGAWSARQVADLHSNFGAFKVPTLRGLTQTAPYFHNGTKATLADVVRHYSEIDPERLHSDGEKIIEPLGLSEREIDDLVAFLRSLSDQ